MTSLFSIFHTSLFSENRAYLVSGNNNGIENVNRYTFHLRPWKLVYVEAFESYELAIKRERNLKQASRQRILEIIKLPKNIVDTYKNRD